jgi:DNA-binding NtrC family response regulator
MARILIVEDDRNTLSGLVEILQEEGYDVVGLDNALAALRQLERERFDILLTDFKMPDVDGLQLYERTASIAPDMKTIIMTAYSSVKDAVEAMKRGVYEYLTKPLNLDELFVVLRKATDDQDIRREVEQLRKEVKGAYRFENIVGASEPMQQVFRTIMKVAKSQATVLIRGESGTGKELVARAIHYNSPRAEKPLVDIFCPSFPETLLESELFGYEKGAFTGAATRKKGRFEMANGGSIFLDEIGDISAGVQTKLLRVLQEKQITRLGSTSSMAVDVRVITATNRDLERALTDGAFREDLYYRLNVIPIVLPPLRHRKEDIPELIRHFSKKYSMSNNRPFVPISDEALAHCYAYDWPGNVRELENAIENAIVLGESEVILPEHLPFAITARSDKPLARPMLFNGKTFRQRMQAAERMVLEEAIEQAGGNKSEAAKSLGISLRTMRYKIRKYKL